MPRLFFNNKFCKQIINNLSLSIFYPFIRILYNDKITFVLPITKLLHSRIIKVQMMQSNTLQDQMIVTYIEQVFNKYDRDCSGSLDVREMTHFFNDLFKSLKINTVVTDAQSEAAIKSIDENSDGMVSKEELFKAFKIMLNPPQQNTSQQSSNVQRQGYGQGYQNQGNTNPYGQYSNQNVNPYSNNQPNQGYNNYQQGISQSYNPGYQQSMNQGYSMNNSVGYPSQSYVPRPQPRVNNIPYGQGQYSTNPYQTQNNGYNGPNNYW